MPLRSESQRRWMHAVHPEMAARWEKETPPGPLPEKVQAKRKNMTLERRPKKSVRK